MGVLPVALKSAFRSERRKKWGPKNQQLAPPALEPLSQVCVAKPMMGHPLTPHNSTKVYRPP